MESKDKIDKLIESNAKDASLYKSVRFFKLNFAEYENEWKQFLQMKGESSIDFFVAKKFELNLDFYVKWSFCSNKETFRNSNTHTQ